ncbi:hypothetical protein IE53DRAFT_224211 [Violaceomyces palustris]|uniref:Uncharacterized protein n=1 Tax=Violaceomyces palustris TaxID=1673888 RepID=A0ACD0NQ09_9BASI|nr:hypothetical protein IE53DRAFT_224211 [Violaceomyces palustris]
MRRWSFSGTASLNTPIPHELVESFPSMRSSELARRMGLEHIGSTPCISRRHASSLQARLDELEAKLWQQSESFSRYKDGVETKLQLQSDYISRFEDQAESNFRLLNETLYECAEKAETRSVEIGLVTKRNFQDLILRCKRHATDVEFKQVAQRREYLDLSQRSACESQQLYSDIMVITRRQKDFEALLKDFESIKGPCQLFSRKVEILHQRLQSIIDRIKSLIDMNLNVSDGIQGKFRVPLERLENLVEEPDRTSIPSQEHGAISVAEGNGQGGHDVELKCLQPSVNPLASLDLDSIINLQACPPARHENTEGSPLFFQTRILSFRRYLQAIQKGKARNATILRHSGKAFGGSVQNS